MGFTEVMAIVFIGILFFVMFFENYSKMKLEKEKEIEKNNINWNEKYNTKKVNDAIFESLSEYLTSLKFAEELDVGFFCGVDEAIEILENEHPNFESKKLLTALKENNDFESLVLFFVEYELNKENLKFEIDTYNERIETIRNNIENMPTYFNIDYILLVNNPL